MRKTQVVSVLALMLVLGIYTSGSTYAKDSLVTAAEAAQAAPESSISAKYPGLDKYLDKMISQYEDNSSAGAAEALSEATEAVNLLKGVNVKTQSETVSTQPNSVSGASQNVPSAYSSNPVAQVANTAETKQPEQVATNIAVKVEEKPVVQAQEVVAESKVEEKTEGSKGSTKAEEQPEMTDDVELPNTGVEKKIGAGEMILVSAAVVIATVGATLMVLRSRKK